MRKATRIIVSTIGILCGISGLEHWFFETLQGNTVPNALLISAIGSGNRNCPDHHSQLLHHRSSGDAGGLAGHHLVGGVCAGKIGQ